jgi:hypothetical protein
MGRQKKQGACCGAQLSRWCAIVTLVCYNAGGGCRNNSRASYTNASSSPDNEVWPNSASSNSKERDISEHHKR